jgi:hypothetical protein
MAMATAELLLEVAGVRGSVPTGGSSANCRLPGPKAPAVFLFVVVCCSDDDDDKNGFFLA